jgi:hypothetical protein
VLEATSSCPFKYVPAAKLKSVTKNKLIIFKQFSDNQLATVTFELSNRTLLKLLSNIVVHETISHVHNPGMTSMVYV